MNWLWPLDWRADCLLFLDSVAARIGDLDRRWRPRPASNAANKKAPSFEGAFRRPTGRTRATIYRARRTAFFVRAFAFTLDVRTARFTFRVVFALAAFAGRATLL